MPRISDVMTPHVHTVSPHDTLRRAARMMDEANLGALPVCDGGRLVGMVTDRDIAVRAVSAGIAPDEAVVDDVMSTDVRWCYADQALDEVMRQMADTQVRRIPVLSRAAPYGLVGIVSLGDLATRMRDHLPPPQVRHVMQQVSMPSAPDRSAAGNTSAPMDKTARIRASGTGTAMGLAGSDVLAEQMNPGVEVSQTEDPSEIVEVTPDDLVNRQAPGSMALRVKRANNGSDGAPEPVKVIRRTAGGSNTPSGAPGSARGIDAGAFGCLDKER